MTTTIRPDGRTADQKRTILFTPEFTRYAEGSVLIEMGHTRVLCNASVENRVPAYLRDAAQGWVTAEYALLPRSTHTRTQREVSKGHPSGRTYEIQRLIARALRAVCDLRRLGERTITVDCDVLQADGGTRTAAITGGFVALALAIKKLQDRGDVGAGVLRDHLAAISVGVLDNTPILDLCYEEDSRAETDMNLVVTGAGQFVELQGTAEAAPFTADHLQEMLRLGQKGAAELVQAQKDLLASRGIVVGG